jgi:hypothetical protein
MNLEIRRLHLAALRGPDGREWPVHGFVIIHPGGAALVDTGVGGPDDLLSDWRVVNRTAADALAGIGMSPADIGLVINTHLHLIPRQNAVFAHAPGVRAAGPSWPARAAREAPELLDWLGFMNASFELPSTATPRSCPGCRSSARRATPRRAPVRCCPHRMRAPPTSAGSGRRVHPAPVS